ncbi:MAG: hypothetical protein A2X32_09590 [Elusimicrobia bacterium GWC2_64_44]|nr:MAG: hypothetical protein A2X32_09590 [Elusimicrobia bacterium GWC2_64_44]
MAKFRAGAGIVEKALVLKSRGVSEKAPRAWERRRAERADAAPWRSRGPETVWQECACCGQAL